MGKYCADVGQFRSTHATAENFFFRLQFEGYILLLMARPAHRSYPAAAAAVEKGVAVNIVTIRIG